jgi:hypothetical protein
MVQLVLRIGVDPVGSQVDRRSSWASPRKPWNYHRSCGAASFFMRLRLPQTGTKLFFERKKLKQQNTCEKKFLKVNLRVTLCFMEAKSHFKFYLHHVLSMPLYTNKSLYFLKSYTYSGRFWTGSGYDLRNETESGLVTFMSLL